MPLPTPLMTPWDIRKVVFWIDSGDTYHLTRERISSWRIFNYCAASGLCQGGGKNEEFWRGSRILIDARPRHAALGPRNRLSPFDFAEPNNNILAV
jgi:hypothetical protein